MLTAVPAAATSPSIALCAGLNAMYASPGYLSQHWPSFPLLATSEGASQVVLDVNRYDYFPNVKIPAADEGTWQLLLFYIGEQRNIVTAIDAPFSAEPPTAPALLAVAKSQQATLVSEIRGEFAALAPLATRDCSHYNASSVSDLLATSTTQVAMNHGLTHHRAHPTSVDFTFAANYESHLISVAQIDATGGIATKVGYEVATVAGNALVCTTVPNTSTHVTPSVVTC